MNVKPTHTGQTPQPGTGPLRETPAASPARDRAPVAAPRPATPDRVELSDVARKLNELLGAEEAGAPSLAPERLKKLLQRVAEGYYDRPEVREELLQRLASELGVGPSDL
jgi:hypothetical protein